MIEITQHSKSIVHQGSVYGLAAGNEAGSFLSAGSEGVILQWHLHQPNSAKAVARVDGQIFSILYLPDLHQLVIGTMSGGLHVIDLEKKKEIHYFTNHEQSIFDIRFHQSLVWVVSKDGTLSVWNPIGWQPLHRIHINDQSLRQIAFHPDKKEAAIGCSDNKIYLFDIAQWKISSALEGPVNSVFSVCYSPDGKHLMAGSRDAQLYIFDCTSNRLMSQIKAHLFTINQIEFILGNKYFVTGSRDKTIRIWNKSFELVKSLDKEKYDGHINSVNRLLWLQEQSMLVSTGDDRSVIAWKIIDGD